MWRSEDELPLHIAFLRATRKERMNPSTIKAILNEADVLEERVVELRNVAAQLQKLFDKSKTKPQETNGILLSAVPVRARKTKKKEKPGAWKKRKYTKRSAFWAKK